MNFVQRHFTHHTQFSSLLFQNPVRSFTPLAASTRSRLRFYSSESDSPVEKKPDPVIESASVAEAHVKDVALPVEDVSNKAENPNQESWLGKGMKRHSLQFLRPFCGASWLGSMRRRMMN